MSNPTNYPLEKSTTIAKCRQPKRLATPRDLFAAIPSEWMDAEITIGTSLGGAIPIKRVSLHVDAAGRRVVIIHDRPLD